MNFSILYRGPLSSCNYGCEYCPFAKTKNTRAELKDDARKLGRFVKWIKEHPHHHFGILFTPWGEALIRSYYRQAIIELSHLPNVTKVAIQTNLSCPTSWLYDCRKETVAIWATYHPTQTRRKTFIDKCHELDKIGIRYSVGTVGFKEAYREIKALKEELAPDIYLWVNANKRQSDYYMENDLADFTQIDPLFRYNTLYHPSFGKACQTGESVFSVDGEGTMYRCHFNKTPIGNIYDPSFEKSLFPRFCTNSTCGCHIGYVHMNELKLYEVFSDGVLERIPDSGELGIMR
jgi:MoaA/NifB/PqqE/SkfB family radical SAM enzyme